VTDQQDGGEDGYDAGDGKIGGMKPGAKIEKTTYKIAEKTHSKRFAAGPVESRTMVL
jgi:hypothetical protein